MRRLTLSLTYLLILGTTKAQMASCYLLTMCDDSIEGIFETLRRCAIISKNAGGIGLAISCIRANGSYIEGVSARLRPWFTRETNAPLHLARPTAVPMVFSR